VKEIQVRSWCDGCEAEVGHANAEPATVEVTVTLPPLGPRLLDLCESHEKGLVEPLRSLLLSAGQDASRTPQTPTKPPGRNGPAARVPDRFPCLWCPETFGAQGGYMGHLVRVHGLPEGSTSATIYGTRCPLCGQGFDRVTSVGTHGRLVHGARSVAAAFVMADAAGDPHKLVSKAKRKGKP